MSENLTLPTCLAIKPQSEHTSLERVEMTTYGMEIFEDMNPGLGAFYKPDHKDFLTFWQVLAIGARHNAKKQGNLEHLDTMLTRLLLSALIVPKINMELPGEIMADMAKDLRQGLTLIYKGEAHVNAFPLVNVQNTFAQMLAETPDDDDPDSNRPDNTHPNG